MSSLSSNEMSGFLRLHIRTRPTIFFISFRRTNRHATTVLLTTTVLFVFEASSQKSFSFGERYVGERQSSRHNNSVTPNTKGILVPERVIGKHQNNPEKRPVFHAERRNEEGEEHGEEGGVHRWNACGVRPPLCGGGGGGGGGGGNEASLGISLSRFVVVRAQNADFMQGKIDLLLLKP